MEKLYIEFFKSGVCTCCGSQRCDGSPEWLEGCQEWQKFIEQHKNSI